MYELKSSWNSYVNKIQEINLSKVAIKYSVYLIIAKVSHK